MPYIVRETTPSNNGGEERWRVTETGIVTLKKLPSPPGEEPGTALVCDIHPHGDGSFFPRTTCPHIRAVEYWLKSFPETS